MWNCVCRDARKRKDFDAAGRKAGPDDDPYADEPPVFSGPPPMTQQLTHPLRSRPPPQQQPVPEPSRPRPSPPQSDSWERNSRPLNLEGEPSRPRPSPPHQDSWQSRSEPLNLEGKALDYGFNQSDRQGLDTSSPILLNMLKAFKCSVSCIPRPIDIGF